MTMDFSPKRALVKAIRGFPLSTTSPLLLVNQNLHFRDISTSSLGI
jgi:hypothetical protein